MAKVQVLLTGDKALNAKLAKLAGPIAKRLISRAGRAALKPVQEQAQRNAPKDSGRLERSIKVKALRRSRGRVGVRVTTSNKDNVFTGRTFYGAFIEYGWHTGKRKSAKRRPVNGELYMKRAARSKRSTALDQYRESLRFGINELIK